AAAMGLDVDIFLARALEMAELCKRGNPSENPGALLGLVLGACHRIGRDKLTIVASPDIYDLGAWLEQLIAESTGKNGVAIIPVDREPIQPAVSYGNDRLFVHLAYAGVGSDSAEIQQIAHSGQPFVRIELDDLYDIGREF